MAALEKLLIRGIRSFDDKQASVIEFYSPVTVIVGHNGSGKTVRYSDPTAFLRVESKHVDVAQPIYLLACIYPSTFTRILFTAIHCEHRLSLSASNTPRLVINHRTRKVGPSSMTLRCTASTRGRSARLR